MWVENMKSKSSGRPIAHQFILTGLFNGTPGIAFQSFNKVIAIRLASGKITLDANDWDSSPTTAKYRCRFLDETKQQTQLKIESGEIDLTDLNSLRSYYT